MQNNNGNSAVGLGVAFAFAAIWIFFALIYAVAAFVALVISVMAVIALFHPLHFGKYSLEEKEARAFLLRGIAGAFVLTGFCIFAEAMFNTRIRPDFWAHIIIAGYCLGSLGGEVVIANQKEERERQAREAAAQALLLPMPTEQRPSRAAESRTQLIQTIHQRAESLADDAPKPFRLATWDDEEELRK